MTIPGVRWAAIERHADDRGSLAELWRADRDNEAASFVQSNQSISAVGVLRGLHLHRRQVDRWVVTSGRAFVALVDVRGKIEASPSAVQPGPVVDARELSRDETVTIPSGIAHGFLALEPLELVYFVSQVYDGSDEHGFAWDDPAAAVPWPAFPTADGRPILSSRDRANPPLDELVRSLRSGRA